MSSLETALLNALTAGPATGPELMASTGISQATLSRTLAALRRTDRVLKIGAARNTRYALRREIVSAGSAWPIFQVDEAGGVQEIGRLHALRPRHYCLTSDNPALAGVTDDLPYCLQDQRPSGFLGRCVPTRWPELALPPRALDWSDDHYLSYLTRRGLDTVSDLIVGSEALDRYLDSNSSQSVIAPSQRDAEYPALAEAAMGGHLVGASTHGEHPKFTAVIDLGSTISQVIVKFSPRRTTPVGQRWSDLLLAEHLAHQHLNDDGLTACRSNYFQFGDRAYLEVERFDRVGAAGRRGVVSLLAVDSARYGALDRWSLSALRLWKDGVLSADAADEIRLLEAFGQLIANSDRHFGNLALFDRYDGHFTTAPVYDMLPMLFAPAIDQIVERKFDLPHPTSDTLSVWPRAWDLARAYWKMICAEDRLSDDFRLIGRRVLTLFDTSARRMNA